MFIPIESILKGHGVKKGAAGGMAGYYEARHIAKATGRRFSLPTKHTNPKRDAMVLFLNGTYQRPGADFTIVDDEVIEFAQTVTDAEIAVVSFKDVLPRPPLLYGNMLEDASIMLRKLSPFMQTVLKNPVERDDLDERAARLRAAFEVLEAAENDLEQVAMYWDVRERTSGGIAFGDDFYMEPLNLRLETTATTATAAIGTGQTGLTVASATGLRVGHEVTVYDNTVLERRRITAIDGTTLSVDRAFTVSFRNGAGVARSMGRRDPETGSLVLTRWTDPSDGQVYDVYEHDLRFMLPPNDRFVGWVDALGADVTAACAFCDTYRLEPGTPTASPHFTWGTVDGTGATFTVTTAGGTVGEVFVRLNGERLATLTSGAGLKRYDFVASRLSAGENRLEFVAMNGTAERIAVIPVEKIGVEVTRDLIGTRTDDETQVSGYHDRATDLMLRVGVTRSALDTPPEVRRIFGAFDS